MTFDLISPPHVPAVFKFLTGTRGNIIFTFVVLFLVVIADGLVDVPGVPDWLEFSVFYLILGFVPLLSIIIWSRYQMSTQQKEVLGKLMISPDQIAFDTLGNPVAYPMSAARRIDVYLAYGAFRPLMVKDVEAFPFLRVKATFDFGVIDSHVSNLDENGQAGALVRHLQGLRKSSVDLHRKIQFWEKFG